MNTLFFPLGYYHKEQVREIAKKNGLLVHDKEESQDFYGGSYSDLLNLQDQEGNIIDKNGTILGTHKGIWNFTHGQRRGLGIAAGKPLYVIDINPEKNEIITGFEEESYNNGFFAKELNWIAFPSLKGKMEVCAKLRSTQEGKKAVQSIEADLLGVRYFDGSFSSDEKIISNFVSGSTSFFYLNDLNL